MICPMLMPFASSAVYAGLMLEGKMADTLEKIIAEMLVARTSERQGRLIDHDPSASMEKKKQEGYF